MLAKRDHAYRLPAAPLPIGGLIEASMALWWASWRRNLAVGVLYGLAGMLPALTLGPLLANLVREGMMLFVRDAAPWLPALGPANDPTALLLALWEWLLAPATWGWLLLATLGMFAALSLLIHRQFAQGAPELARGGAHWRGAVAHLPVALAAWAIYTALMLLSSLPLVLLVWGCLLASVQVDVTGLMLLLVLLLAGGLLASVPAAWLSVAAGFAPVLVACEPLGPLRAQRRSVQAVRGRWAHAALGVTGPLVLYLIVGSTVSSACVTLCGGIAWLQDGVPGLLQLRWLAWSQWLALLPMAAALPLATAGMVVTWNDLRLRQASTVP